MNDSINMLRKILEYTSPNTRNALTYMVPAMESVWRNAGKKSFFGKDKGAQSFEKFMKLLKTTILALYDDEIVSLDDSLDTVIFQLKYHIAKFAEAYPNWPDAYSFSEGFFIEENKEIYKKIFEEARNWRIYLSEPKITRSSKI